MIPQEKLAPLRWVGFLTVMALGVALISIFFARALNSAPETVAFDEFKETDTVASAEYRGGLCPSKENPAGVECAKVYELQANGEWKEDRSDLASSKLPMLERSLKIFRQLEREGKISPPREDCGESLADGTDLYLKGHYWDQAYKACQLEGDALKAWEEVAALMGFATS